ncbi:MULTISPECIES: hypothetical protein [Aphanothece]|uniref:hypothetical protein n=1 Tax=Aphanothece TaxID=1121 RepID=UPI0039849A7D
MVFKRKGSFFLDLSGEGGTKEAKPVKVAIAEQPAAQATSAQPAAAAGSQPAPAQTAAQPGAQQSSPAGGASPLTTAEAIAAELRAAQEALPPPSMATYAPECLNPANALPMRRRRPGANLAVFKGMASGMFRN